LQNIGFLPSGDLGFAALNGHTNTEVFNTPIDEKDLRTSVIDRFTPFFHGTFPIIDNRAKLLKQEALDEQLKNLAGTAQMQQEIKQEEESAFDESNRLSRQIHDMEEKYKRNKHEWEQRLTQTARYVPELLTDDQELMTDSQIKDIELKQRFLRIYSEFIWSNNLLLKERAKYANPETGSNILATAVSSAVDGLSHPNQHPASVMTELDNLVSVTDAPPLAPRHQSKIPGDGIKQIGVVTSSEGGDIVNILALTQGVDSSDPINRLKQILISDPNPLARTNALNNLLFKYKSSPKLFPVIKEIILKSPYPEVWKLFQFMGTQPDHGLPFFVQMVMDALNLNKPQKAIGAIRILGDKIEDPEVSQNLKPKLFEPSSFYPDVTFDTTAQVLAVLMVIDPNAREAVLESSLLANPDKKAQLADAIAKYAASLPAGTPGKAAITDVGESFADEIFRGQAVLNVPGTFERAGFKVLNGATPIGNVRTSVKMDDLEEGSERFLAISTPSPDNMKTCLKSDLFQKAKEAADDIMLRNPATNKLDPRIMGLAGISASFDDLGFFKSLGVDGQAEDIANADYPQLARIINLPDLNTDLRGLALGRLMKTFEGHIWALKAYLNATDAVKTFIEKQPWKNILETDIPLVKNSDDNDTIQKALLELASPQRLNDPEFLNLYQRTKTILEFKDDKDPLNRPEVVEAQINVEATKRAIMVVKRNLDFTAKSYTGQDLLEPEEKELMNTLVTNIVQETDPLRASQEIQKDRGPKSRKYHELILNYAKQFADDYRSNNQDFPLHNFHENITIWGTAVIFIGGIMAWFIIKIQKSTWDLKKRWKKLKARFLTKPHPIDRMSGGKLSGASIVGTNGGAANGKDANGGTTNGGHTNGGAADKALLSLSIPGSLVAKTRSHFEEWHRLISKWEGPVEFKGDEFKEGLTPEILVGAIKKDVEKRKVLAASKENNINLEEFTLPEGENALATLNALIKNPNSYKILGEKYPMYPEETRVYLEEIYQAPERVRKDIPVGEILDDLNDMLNCAIEILEDMPYKYSLMFTPKDAGPESSLYQDSYKHFIMLIFKTLSILDIQENVKSLKPTQRKRLGFCINTLFKYLKYSKRFSYILANRGNIDQIMSSKLPDSHRVEKTGANPVLRRSFNIEKTWEVSDERMFQEQGLPTLLAEGNELSPGLYKNPEEIIKQSRELLDMVTGEGRTIFSLIHPDTRKFNREQDFFWRAVTMGGLLGSACLVLLWWINFSALPVLGLSSIVIFSIFVTIAVAVIKYWGYQHLLQKMAVVKDLNADLDLLEKKFTAMFPNEMGKNIRDSDIVALNLEEGKEQIQDEIKAATPSVDMFVIMPPDKDENKFKELEGFVQTERRKGNLFRNDIPVRVIASDDDGSGNAYNDVREKARILYEESRIQNSTLPPWEDARVVYVFDGADTNKNPKIHHFLRRWAIINAVRAARKRSVDNLGKHIAGDILVNTRDIYFGDVAKSQDSGITWMASRVNSEVLKGATFVIEGDNKGIEELLEDINVPTIMEGKRSRRRLASLRNYLDDYYDVKNLNVDQYEALNGITYISKASREGLSRTWEKIKAEGLDKKLKLRLTSDFFVIRTMKMLYGNEIQDEIKKYLDKRLDLGDIIKSRQLRPVEGLSADEILEDREQQKSDLNRVYQIYLANIGKEKDTLFKPYPQSEFFRRAAGPYAVEAIDKLKSLDNKELSFDAASLSSDNGGVNFAGAEASIQFKHEGNSPEEMMDRQILTPLKAFKGFNFQVTHFQPIVNPVELFPAPSATNKNPSSPLFFTTNGSTR